MRTRIARPRDLRLLPVVGGVWLFAGAAVTLPVAAIWLAVAGGAGAAAALLAAHRSRARPAHRLGRFGQVLAVATMTLALGAASALTVTVALPERDALASLPVAGGRAISVQAMIVGKVEPSADGWRFDAITESVGIGELRQTVSAPIVVRVAERPQAIDLGATVTVSGRAFRGDAGSREVLVVEASGIPTVRSPPSGALAASATLRSGLQQTVTGLPAPAAGLIAGLAVGDTSAVTPGLDSAMKLASLSHLTAVSGSNCSLVVGLAYGAVALLGGRRGLRVMAGIGALAGFVVLVSPEPSVVRAATMSAIAMGGLMAGRIGAGLTVWSAAVVLILITDPWLSTSIGFALSAVATASLLVVAGPLADGLTRWMPAPMALAIAVPLAAQLACGPLLVLIDPSVSLYGVVANLLAAPAAPAACVLGLLACVFFAAPVLASGLAALAWLPAAWITSTATIVSTLPGATLPWLPGVGGVIALIVVGVAIVVMVVPGRRSGRRIRRGALVALCVTLAIVMLVDPLSLLVLRATTPAQWSVAACEVGQGDAVLVRSAGRVALIDTGPDPAPLARCLDRFGVGRIDLLVLTHFDLDHRGGLPAVHARVGTVLHGPAPNSDAEQSLDRLREGGARLQLAQAGLQGSLGRSAWRVFWPAPRAQGYSGNDASVVVEFRGGDVPSIVLLGDLSAGPQSALASDVGGGYDLVKVAHHGSADQWPALYERVDARVALLTVGRNSYGHPRAETLDLLRGLGARVMRTDRSGAVAAWLQDGAIRLWSADDVDTAQ